MEQQLVNNSKGFFCSFSLCFKTKQTGNLCLNQGRGTNIFLRVKKYVVGGRILVFG